MGENVHTESNGSTAIAVQETRAIAPRTVRGILTREALQEAAEQRKLLAEFVREQMIEGTDYGTIPGTERKGKDGKMEPNRTLLKPGAEKLVEIFRCTPEYDVLKEVEDYDRGLFAYRFRCRLIQRDADAVIAEGYGSATSYEGKYRWRTAARLCPDCSLPAIIKGKAEYGGGWVCFKKKGGCGAKFNDGDPIIEDQEQGRIENDDLCTYQNTVLKMAKKRALVDGAIALARVSDLFTQDAEDFEHNHALSAEAQVMVDELKAGFANLDAKKAWGEAHKEKKGTLPKGEQEKVAAAFRASPVAQPKGSAVLKETLKAQESAAEPGSAG